MEKVDPVAGDRTLQSLLDALSDTVLMLKRMPVPDEGTADFAGDVRHSEKILAETRLDLLREFDGTQKGDRYELVSSRQAKRTYDGQKILTDLMDWDGREDLLAVILLLRDYGALKLTFSYSKLKQFFEVNRIPFTEVAREIGDGAGDGAHVGAVWGQTIALKGVKQEGIS